MSRDRGAVGRIGRAAATAALLSAAGGLAACEPAVLSRDEWRAYEADLLADGLLRTERAPADAPLTNAMLVRNFDIIAFGLEPDLNDGRSRERLRRWAEPLRWQFFIDGAGAEVDTIGREVQATFARIGTATGLDIAPAGEGAPTNLDIVFLGPDDYAAVRAGAGEIDARLVDTIETFRTSDMPCAGNVFWRMEPERGIPAGTVAYALVMIRKGFSAAFRRSCIEEELAQTMGLRNDDPRVRPSIFNDDEEFALLTTHDELLLRILYDPRLRAGMSSAEAMPLVARIVEDLRPGG